MNMSDTHLPHTLSTPMERPPTRAVGDRCSMFQMRLSAIDSAAVSIMQSAECAEKVMQELVSVVELCSNIKSVSVLMSVNMDELADAPTACGMIAEKLHKDASGAMVAAHRISRQVKLLINSIEQTSTLITLIASVIDETTPGAAGPVARE